MPVASAPAPVNGTCAGKDFCVFGTAHGPPQRPGRSRREQFGTARVRDRTAGDPLRCCGYPPIMRLAIHRAALVRTACVLGCAAVHE